MTNAGYELHRFADAFKSEDDLRKHLAALLNKMPHTQSVQITHGTQEYGKDIVFYAPDGFDNWQLNACVIKKTKITGSVDDNDGARTVFHQAEQALDTPFINGLGEKERVSKVFIISPFDCSQSTMHSIQGKLETHFGKIEFLCGSKLFEKFSKHWPEFVIFESTLLGTYVAALQQSFDQSDPINFLASQNYIFSSADKTIRNVYVRQDFKISLQKFDLLVEPPNFNILHNTVSSRDVDSLREQLGFLANLLRYTQAWEVPDSLAALKVVDFLTQFYQSLKETWEQSEQQRREREQRERDRLWRDREQSKLGSQERIQIERARREQIEHKHKEAERVHRENTTDNLASHEEGSQLVLDHFANLSQTPPM